jgi:hypothetical protein
LKPLHVPKSYGTILDRSLWFQMSLAPRWLVVFRVVDQRGQPVIAEVRVFPALETHDEEKTWPQPTGRWRGEYGGKTFVPPGGLTARLLRGIRTQVFQKDLRRIMAYHAKDLAHGDSGVTLSAAPPPSATRGRKGRSDRELARIARTYERAYMAGRPSIADVAKAHRLSLSQARDAVSRARVRGLLSPASTQGKRGGLLTPLAHEILKQDAKGKGGKRHGTKR